VLTTAIRSTAFNATNCTTPCSRVEESSGPDVEGTRRPLVPARHVFDSGNRSGQLDRPLVAFYLRCRYRGWRSHSVVVLPREQSARPYRLPAGSHGRASSIVGVSRIGHESFDKPTAHKTSTNEVVDEGRSLPVPVANTGRVARREAGGLFRQAVSSLQIARTNPTVTADLPHFSSTPVDMASRINEHQHHQT
jgi:hypothetical protein